MRQVASSPVNEPLEIEQFPKLLKRQQQQQLGRIQLGVRKDSQISSLQDTYLNFCDSYLLI